MNVKCFNVTFILLFTSIKEQNVDTKTLKKFQDSGMGAFIRCGVGKKQRQDGALETASGGWSRG